MTIQVKHSKVSTIPDTDDTSLVRPSDWNADHTLVGLGTMAEQNANAVAITGGTINGTTIGATTPSTVNATTITGQTGVLRGTGQNFLLQSQTFNTTWTTTGSSVSPDTDTAPDGTLTADSVKENAATTNHRIQQTLTALGGSVVYTLSVYVKQKTGSRFATVGFNSDGSNFVAATFDLSNGTNTQISIANYANASVTSTSAGNNWYRVTLTATTNATLSTILLGLSATSTFVSNSRGFDSYAGDNTSEILYWGAQLELGSTANTYIPTTTTAVYGTPTLSFSGVSEIGLLSNGALYLQPAGTGAIQAQATTSTTAGGNVRGANAVDWQTSRAGATQVASASFSTIGGGANNTASTSNGTTIAGGRNNTSSAQDSFVGGGNANTSSGLFSSSVGGASNVASGYYGFVGGGQTNSTTSNSAVTTQSGTMNATTAVTLSGSNANIKVGQFISGTSIANNTYVAAISGTALTLSKVASGSSTSTLSFFTPHGVVVGGGNNQATGAYSAILGGGDAGTAANRNVASGDWSFVGGGTLNTASGLSSVVVGGGINPNSGTREANTASGGASFVGGGAGNTASGNIFASVVGGRQNLANSSYGIVAGGAYGTTRLIIGNTVFPASNTPLQTFAQGSTQSAMLVLARQTTDATATALASDGNAAGTTNQVILPNNSAYLFKATVISNVTGGGNTSGWKLEGVIKRGANAASTAIVGSVTTTLLAQDAGASGWVIAATADTTNGGLRITFTGQASTTIRTVCKVETTEVTF